VNVGHCSKCQKVWTLEKGQGVCPWCSQLAICQNARTPPRPIKSSRDQRQRQAHIGISNGYDQLSEPWLTYYKVASRFAHKAQAQDREDLLQDIILTLAQVAGNNGHKPLAEATMCRIASYTVADYWRDHYRLANGLDCGSCSQAQRRGCRKNWLYPECPRAIKLESLDKPIADDEGNLTELGELIADDQAIDLDAWLDAKTWLAGFPERLISIAHKRQEGIPLVHAELCYLSRWRASQQGKLFE